MYIHQFHANLIEKSVVFGVQLRDTNTGRDGALVTHDVHTKESLGEVLSRPFHQRDQIRGIRPVGG